MHMVLMPGMLGTKEWLRIVSRNLHEASAVVQKPVEDYK
jgi:hypothetical protein